MLQFICRAGLVPDQSSRHICPCECLPSNLCDPQADNIDQMVTGEHALRDIESETVADQIDENLKPTAMCAQRYFRGASRAGMEENLKRTVVIDIEVHVRVCLHER